jgi:hypothetical protein
MVAGFDRASSGDRCFSPAAEFVEPAHSLLLYGSAPNTIDNLWILSGISIFNLAQARTGIKRFANANFVRLPRQTA